MKDNSGSHLSWFWADCGSSRAVGEIIVWDKQVPQQYTIPWIAVLLCDLPFKAWYFLPTAVYYLFLLSCQYTDYQLVCLWLYQSITSVSLCAFIYSDAVLLTIITSEVLFPHCFIPSDSDLPWPPLFCPIFMNIFSYPCRDWGSFDAMFRFFDWSIMLASLCLHACLRAQAVF